MALFKSSNVLICFIILAFVLPYYCDAQNSQTDYLNTHNSARSQVGVGAITWNTTLENYAQNYANQRISDCNLVHSNGPYGENIAKGSGSFMTGTAAVNLWVGEKPYYDYNSNSCTGGKECRHYTQVVWKNSIQLGCARVQCTNGWWFVTCNYNPPGNYIGQRPY
ncbi:pathogenesis-related leaf protein 6 [Solanum lycopersicum]|uniref:pathogenesis-related leaf protein 6 n=1 Tax=Solanum lycopersicum TaxID=4081 RepID=UPI00027678CF|nr:pathogenesis-related leaf protein 6 [Solanum lycopersicum]